MELPTYVIIGLGMYAVIVVVMAYAMCKSAAPQNEKEQAENDTEQMEYLRNRD